MKMRFIFFLFVFLFQKDVMGHSVSIRKEQNQLSSAQQLGCNPLKNFKSFAIHPQYSISAPRLCAEVDENVARKLATIGKVETLQAPNPIGYGNAQACITISLKEINTLEGQTVPITQVSLSITSPILIQKTKVQCSTYVWSLEVFAAGNIQENNRKNILTSVNEVVDQFIEEYKKYNSNQKETPVFYLYTL